MIRGLWVILFYCFVVFFFCKTNSFLCNRCIHACFTKTMHNKYSTECRSYFSFTSFKYVQKNIHKQNYRIKNYDLFS